MKTLLITLLLSISIFGQSGKSVLTQAQKDSIGVIVIDSLGGYWDSTKVKSYLNINNPYFISMVGIRNAKEIPFDYLHRDIVIDSVSASTYDSTFSFNIFYGTNMKDGGTDLFNTYETISADTTFGLSVAITKNNYLRLNIIPTGSDGEIYAIKIFYH